MPFEWRTESDSSCVSQCFVCDVAAIGERVVCCWNSSRQKQIFDWAFSTISYDFQTHLKYIDVSSLPDTVSSLISPGSALTVFLLHIEGNFVDRNIVALSAVNKYINKEKLNQ